MEQLQAKFDVWNQKFLKVGQIKSLSQKANLLIIVFGFALVLLLVFGFALDIGVSLCTCTIVVAYATLRSILVLESKSPDDDKQWLTYWSIYGLIDVFDQMSLIPSNIPYYFFLKACFLIWLFNPQTNGATVIYTKAISPLLKKVQPQLAEFGKLIDSFASSNTENHFYGASKAELKKNNGFKYSVESTMCVKRSGRPPFPLSLRDKINLAYSCSSLLETQKQQHSSELYTSYQNSLRELVDSLTNQEYIVANIEELSSGLNKTISKCKDIAKVNDYKNQVKFLKTLKQSLEQKLFQNDYLIRELQKSCHVSESIIRLTLQTDPKLIHQLEEFKLIEAEIKILIDFMNIHFNDKLHEKLSSKVHIVKDNFEILQIYLGKWQQTLNTNYRNDKFEHLIDMLFRQMSFNGTRFELFAYTFKNLLKEICPEQIFRLFTSKNEVYRLQWNDQIFGTEIELYYIIELIGLSFAWIDANNQLFGTSSQPIIMETIGQLTDEQIMQQGIKTFGLKYYQSVLLNVEDKVCGDSYQLCLPNHYTNLVGTIHNLVQDFAKMLLQHGEQPKQSMNQSIMQQAPAFLNLSYLAPQIPSQHEITVNLSIQNQTRSVYSQLSEPVRFKIKRRDFEDEE